MSNANQTRGTEGAGGEEQRQGQQGGQQGSNEGQQGRETEQKRTDTGR